MNIRSTFVIIALTGFVGVAGADVLDDQELIAQSLAERQAADEPQETATPASDRAQDELSRLEEQARIDLVLSQARLELIQSRKALRARRFVEAARKAQTVLTLLKQLPTGVDASVYELQAEGILAKAERAGVAIDRVPATAPESPEERRLAAATYRLDGQARAAAQIARGYDGADTADIDTHGDAQALRERALWNQMPDEYGYRPSKEIIDVETVLERDRQRLYYQDALRTAYQADEARLLVEADEARVTPQGIVSYPDNWPEIVAKRAKYKDGVIARSPSWIDQDGREWYVALYDIRDLIYIVPNFQPPMGVTAGEQLRNLFDREALRWRSEIFGGLPEDLAAGLPLLRYFGGIDDRAGPRYSAERQQRIVEMIKAFVGPRTTEPTIQAVGP
jgi:hypothetical protein